MLKSLRFCVLWGVGGPYPWNHVDWYERAAGWRVLQIGQLSVEVCWDETANA